MKAFVNNGRAYVIHINMQIGAQNRDQLAAYYLARLLDTELLKAFNDSISANQDHSAKINSCYEVAEEKFSQIDIDKFIADLARQGWSLEYIYLDRRNNVYEAKIDQKDGCDKD